MNNVTKKHRGWFSRGLLPHFDSGNEIQFITFRLNDAVPADLLAKWKLELDWNYNLPSDDPKIIELCRRIAKFEDTGCGACWLKDTRIAELVQNALIYFDGERYGLQAWSIMPNHVHVLINIEASHPLETVVHSWKSYTAKEANKILQRTGTFWFREYYDRYVRDEDHLVNVVRYIESNPVKAGLVKAAGDWLFGSAYALAGRMPALPVEEPK